MMIVVTRGPVLIFMSIISVLSCCIFLLGFFPVKRMISGKSTNADLPDALWNDNNTVSNVDRPLALFDRCVIMVIDALRADFIELRKELMPYVQKLISDGHAMTYTAYTHPPTVTLPRIKALMTGSIPGFVDVVLNFGSSELTEDNLISQLTGSGRKAVFYGDDTWLKLFPDEFERSDGTTSFFVADYTEVDDNVTRHLERELQEKDWSLMILHYLGLDHIGHLSNPRSSLIPPKLLEMDGIVHRIFSTMMLETGARGRSLLVVCGDHGMSDNGGHGGASAGETAVPVLFISPNIVKHSHAIGQFPRVQQVDIAPTLSTLLGLPIPVNNLGSILPGVLSGYTAQELTQALRINAVQVVKVLQHNSASADREEGYLQFVRAEQRHRDWLRVRGSLSEEAWQRLGMRVQADYSQAMQLMAAQISRTATNYDMYALGLAIFTLWMVLVLLILLVLRAPLCLICITPSHLLWSLLACLPLLLGHMTLCTSLGQTSFLCQFSMAGAVTQGCLLLSLTACLVLLGVLLFQKGNKEIQALSLSRLELFLVGGTVLHTVSLLSSSFVEEEHQTWFLLTMSFHIISIVTLASKVWSPALRGERETGGNSESSLLSSCTCLSDGEENIAPDLLQTTSSKSRAMTGNALDCIQHRERRDGIQDERQEALGERDLSRETVHRKTDGEKDQQTDLVGSVVVWNMVSLAAVAALCRVLRTWNQTGDKWLHLPDTGDWLNSPDCKLELSVSVALALLTLAALWGQSLSWSQTLIFLGASASIYCFRAASGALLLPGLYTHLARGMMEAKVAYAGAGLLLLCWLRERRVVGRWWWQSHQCWNLLQAAWLVVMLLLLRPHNVPLTAMLSAVEMLMSGYLQRLQLRPASIAVWCAWMGQASFFYQGNSNSLSSMDVASGFVGVDSYLPVIHGLLMYLATYAGTIFWDLTTLKYLCTWNGQAAGSSPRLSVAGGLLEAATVLLLRRVLVVAVYTTLVTAQRYHLFVWTVFSPKLLYEGVALIHTSIVCLLLVLLARKFGSREDEGRRS